MSLTLDDIAALGEAAGRLNQGRGSNPYPGGVRAQAWDAGYLRGQREQEILEQELNGDVFFR